MNKRIEQLIKQAYVDADHGAGSYFDKEKFAELIVRECMSNLYIHGYDDAMTQIEQHFGVEL
jgi:hypothetical protein